LGDWLADPANPLTSRVMVNRICTITLDAALPALRTTLVSWRAATNPSCSTAGQRVCARGWSIKRMHRLIVTSNTYRQASLIVRL